jgi:hypothetical protein
VYGWSVTTFVIGTGTALVSGAIARKIVASGLCGVIVTGTPSRSPESLVAYSTTFPLRSSCGARVLSVAPPWLIFSSTPVRLRELIVNCIILTGPFAVRTVARPS